MIFTKRRNGVPHPQEVLLVSVQMKTTRRFEIGFESRFLLLEQAIRCVTNENTATSSYGPRLNGTQVNATGTQFAHFEGEDNSIPPIAMGSHLDTVATGGRFDGPLGVIS